MLELWRDEVTLATSYAAGPLDIGEAVELLRSRRVRVGKRTRYVEAEALILGDNLIGNWHDDDRSLIGVRHVEIEAGHGSETVPVRRGDHQFQHARIRSSRRTGSPSRPVSGVAGKHGRPPTPTSAVVANRAG